MTQLNLSLNLEEIEAAILIFIRTKAAIIRKSESDIRTTIKDI